MLQEVRDDGGVAERGSKVLCAVVEGDGLAVPNPARVSLTMAWSSADRNAERSRGENGFGPLVISPELRSESHQVAGGKRHADRVLAERPAVRRDGFGARFHGPARQRHVRRDDDIAMPARRDPVVASSMPAPTTTRSIMSSRCAAIGELLTTKTFSAVPLRR